jgi:predicted TIM-barrel fold metal-dependent hydrolase
MTVATRSPLNDVRIVDACARVQETVDAILPYVDDSSLPKRLIGYSTHPRDDVYSGTSAFPLYQYKRRDENGERRVRGAPTDRIPPSEVAARAASLGIDTAIVNPTLNRGLAEVNNSRFAYALAVGYNRWVLDRIDGEESLRANLVVPPQVPNRAAALLDDRADDDRVAGVTLPVTGLAPPIGHRRYDPLLEAAARHGFPVTLPTTVGMKPFHQQYFASASFAEDWVYHSPLSTMFHLASLLYEGVFERYPSLDVVLEGAGLGIAPYFVQRMDDHYLELGYEIPTLEQLPSEYCRDSVYWCTRPIGSSSGWQSYHEKMATMIGPENVLYSSDLPHAETDTPEAVASCFEGLADETVAGILGDTASRLFDA